MDRIEFKQPTKKKKSTIHTASHALAEELAKQMGEPKKFGLYLGLASRYNHQFLRGIAGRVLEINPKNKAAYFMFLVKKESESIAKPNKENKK